eukprot:Colp12_sorted_trinity150504_noHs@9815
MLVRLSLVRQLAVAGCRGYATKSKSENVLLMGFQGSKPRQLRHYRELYEKRGFNVSIFCPPYLENYDIPLVQPSGIRLYNKLLEEGEPSHIHCFSGSAYVLSYMLQFAAVDKNVEKICRSIIIDSGPVEITHSNLVSALNVYLKSQNLGFIPRPLLSMAMRAWERKCYLHLNTFRTQFDHIMTSRSLENCPMLFLYSTADSVAPYKTVENYIERAQQNNPAVFWKNFGDSDHTRHLTKYPEEYAETVMAFMDEVQLRQEEATRKNDAESESVRAASGARF